MPSIELKSIDRIGPSDRLLVDADRLLTAGQKISENNIKLFGKYKIAFIPTINFSYEEVEKLNLYYDDKQIDSLLVKEIQKRNNRFLNLRTRLFEKVKSFYIPYSEADSCFCTKGKKKQLTIGKLLDKNPGPLYQPDIDAGSSAIIRNSNLKFVAEILKAMLDRMDKLTYLGPDTVGQKNRLHRITLSSVRFHSLYDKTRLASVGTALPWHAVDCALYFLFAMVNLNKKRIIAGLPMSTERFDPDKSVDKGMVFQYRLGMILDATIGILLHALGLCHESVHKICSIKPVILNSDPTAKRKMNILRRNNYVIRNLVRNRREISSLSRMICSLQYDYTDGTGFPPLNENKNLHEFVRFFQIIDFYDEMTNPVISDVIYSRMDVINYMKKNSGEYRHSTGKYVEQARFDNKLLAAFLQIIAPYEIGEKVYLFPKNKKNSCAFVGRVHSYINSYIPVISILRDARNDKSYRYGQIFFNIPSSEIIVMDGGKIDKKTKANWIQNLTIYDVKLNPGLISEYQDILFGKKRILSKYIKARSI